MSERGLKFVELWITNHIHAQPFVSELGGDQRPEDYASACMKDALTDGLHAYEIEDEYLDLSEVIRDAVNLSTATSLDRIIADEELHP